MRLVLPFSIITLLALLLQPFDSEAKIPRWWRFNYGARCGINWAQLKNDQIRDKNSYRLGLNAGVFVRYKVARQMSLLTEIAFSQKGDKYQYYSSYLYPGVGSVAYDNTTRLNYLDTNHFLVFGLPTRRSQFKFRFLLGLNVAFFLDGDNEIRDYYLGEIETTEYSAKEINTPEIGLAIAFEMDYKHLMIQPRYTFTFQNYHDEIEGRNSMMSVLLGWVI
ncbi:MAG: PorT family protein [FCB group bacterium]|nr:PorT family protein [FCB group bacterium]